MDITEFRRQHPEYNDINDTDLATSLHEKFYSDVPYEQFINKFIPISAPPPSPPEARFNIPDPTDPYAKKPIMPSHREAYGERTRTGEAVAGVSRAFLNMGAGVTSLIERPTKFGGEFISSLGGYEAIKRFTELNNKYNKLPQIRENIQAQAEALAPTRGGVGGWVLNTVAEGAPQLATMLATGSINLAIPFVLQFATAGEQYYQDAKKRGAPEDEALRDYTLGGMVEGALEYWGVEKLLGLKQLGKGSFRQLSKQIKNKLWKQAAGNIKNITSDMLKGAIVEGLEEASQAIGGFGVQALPGGGDIPRKVDGTPDYKEMLRQTELQAAGGALLGALAGGTLGGISDTTTPTKEVVDIETPVEVPQDINIYKTVSGSKTGLKETDVTYNRETGKMTDIATGEDVVVDAEASGSGMIKETPAAESVSPIPERKTKMKIRLRAEMRKPDELLKIGHELPDQLGMSNMERLKLMSDTTGKFTMKAMSNEQKEQFVSVLEGMAEQQGVKYIPQPDPLESMIAKLNEKPKNLKTEWEKRTSGVLTRAWDFVKDKTNSFFANEDLISNFCKSLDGYDEEGPIRNNIERPLKKTVVTARDRIDVVMKTIKDAFTENEIDFPAMIHNMRDDVVGGHPLSDTERIGIYMLSKDENGYRRAKAWFKDKTVFPFITDPDTAIQDVVRSVEESPKEMFVADQVRAYIELESPTFITTAKGMGIKDIKTVENYLTLLTEDRNEIESDPIREVFVNNITSKTPVRGKAQTIERTKTSARAVIDIAKILPRMINSMEWLINVGPTAKRVSGLINSKDFKTSVNNVTRGKGHEILQKYLEDVSRGTTEYESGWLTNTARKLRRNAVPYLLGLKIATVSPKAAVSGFLAIAKNPALLPYVIKDLSTYAIPKYGWGKLKSDYSNMINESKVMKGRFIDRDIARVTNIKNTEKYFAGKSPNSTFMNSYIMVDRAITTSIYNHARDKAADYFNDRDLGIRYADDLVSETQPMGNIEDLPGYFRGGTLEKLATTFMNQPIRNWNFLRHNIYGELKAGKIDKTTALTRFMLGEIVPALVLGVISRGRLPDDLKEMADDVGFFLLSPHIFFGRFIYNAVTGQWSVVDSTGLSIPLTGFSEIEKGIGSAKKGEVRKTVEHGIKSIGAFTGKIPQQAVTTVGGALDLATGETDDYKRLVYSEWYINYNKSKKSEETVSSKGIYKLER